VVVVVVAVENLWLVAGDAVEVEVVDLLCEGIRLLPTVPAPGPELELKHEYDSV